MDSDYAANYRRLYENHWWWRAREAAVLQVLQEHCSADSPRRILDIGCGDGLLFDKLAPWGEVEGVEVCSELVSSDNPWRSNIYLGPFDELYQPARKYDLILMLDVLEHFEDPVAALRHASRLLEPDGMLLIHVPAFRALWTSHDDINHHYTRYSQRSLRHVLQQAAFDVTRQQYTFYWTCPVKLAIRAKERLLGTASRPAEVPPSWVNSICYQLCRLEQRLFRRRSPGFGSSILALARPTELCDDTEQPVRDDSSVTVEA